MVKSVIRTIPPNPSVKTPCTEWFRQDALLLCLHFLKDPPQYGSPLQKCGHMHGHQVQAFHGALEQRLTCLVDYAYFA